MDNRTAADNLRKQKDGGNMIDERTRAKVTESEEIYLKYLRVFNPKKIESPMEIIKQGIDIPEFLPKFTSEEDLLNRQLLIMMEADRAVSGKPCFC